MKQEVLRAIETAFAEDLGPQGDITSAVIPKDCVIEAFLMARQDGVLAGIDIARAAFLHINPSIEFEILADDGARLAKGQKLAAIRGPAKDIFTAERVALNFLGHLSGIASLTRRFADMVEGTGARIRCTRKTIPGLRALEKYAVRMGGGVNHRMNLSESVLIKDNHIAALGGIERAVRLFHGDIQVEIDRLDQIEPALQAGAKSLLLDNMDAATLRRAVAQIAGRAMTEASGGVNLQTVRAIADAGVNFIAVGQITHSAPNLDIGLDIP